jgi:hypothetical protein
MAVAGREFVTQTGEIFAERYGNFGTERSIRQHRTRIVQADFKGDKS